MTKVTIIRSANLTVLKTWLIGGQVTNMGGGSEGFHFLTNQGDGEYPALDTVEAVKEQIEFAIDEYGDEPSNGVNGSFRYWGDFYKFKKPNAEKLEQLAKEVFEAIH